MDGKRKPHRLMEQPNHGDVWVGDLRRDRQTINYKVHQKTTLSKSLKTSGKGL